MYQANSHRLYAAAAALLEKHFDVQPGESVLITADTRTEAALVEAVMGAATRAGAKVSAMIIPQLPFQGALADPYLSSAFAAAAANTDVWFDFCFPYVAGSKLHDAAMKAGKARYALLATASADSFTRLYGEVDFTDLMNFQVEVAEYIDSRAGSIARITCPLGSDFSFKLEPVKLKRERVARSPGMHTVPGAQSLYPDLESVKGRIVLQCLFDESYRQLRRPIAIEVDGHIRGFSGAAAEDIRQFERSLKRASSGALGYVIHLTLGFHPAARVGGNFIESIRALGTDAVGLGLPWWVEGGGENHPDGVLLDQSLWFGSQQILDQGRFVGPKQLTELYERLGPKFD